MKSFFYISLFLLLSTLVMAKTSHKKLRVAVIDTGLDITDSRLKKQLCRTGHEDFTGNGLQDTNGHGTHIVGLIEKNAGRGNYCLLIYKFYSDSSSGEINLRNEVEALREAIRNGAKVINFSGGGSTFNKQEYILIRDHPEVTFVVAAGNESHDLDIPGNEYYPASYFLKNEVIVSNIDENGSLVRSSNYGSRVNDMEIGDNVYSTLPNDKMGYMTGTSQATAVCTGKLVKEMLNAK